MMEYFFIYDVATGAQVMRGLGEKGTAAQQTVPDGMGVVTVAQVDYDGGLASVTDPDRLRPGLSSRVDVLRDRRIAAGFAVNFGPLDGQILQTGADADRTNWLVSARMYEKQIAAGNGGVEGANFRTLSNETITLSFADGVAVLDAMALWGTSVMNHSWALKDEIEAAATVTDLLMIDINTGWPS